MNSLGSRTLVWIIALLSLWTVRVAEAKWWIFGQTENEIATRYLYLNGICR